jgi:hypothetical protein
MEADMSLDTDLQAMLQEDSTRLDQADRTLMVEQALRELSSDYPKRNTRDFTGDGAAAYALVDSTTADPAETGLLQALWVRGLSKILGVRHLVDGVWEPLDLEHWREGEEKYGTTTEEWIPSLIFTVSIDTSTTLRLEFTGEWASDDTDLAGRVYAAVVELAAAYAHSAIAAEYAAMTDATLAADSVDQGNLARSHMDLHDLHRKNYRKLMGLQQADGASGTTSAPAVSLQKDLVDFTASHGGVSLRRGYGR